MVSRKRRTPVFKHSPQSAFSQMLRDDVFRQVSKAEPGQSRSKDLAARIENELSVDARIEFPSALLGAS